MSVGLSPALNHLSLVEDMSPTLSQKSPKFAKAIDTIFFNINEPYNVDSDRNHNLANKVTDISTPLLFLEMKDIISTDLAKNQSETSLSLSREEIIENFEKGLECSKKLLEQLDKFTKDFKHIDNQYHSLKANLNGYCNFQGTVLSSFEYFNVNHDNILQLLNHYSNSDDYSATRDCLEILDSSFKLSNCTAPLAYNTIRFFLSKQIQKDLQKLNTSFQILKANSVRYQNAETIKKMDGLTACIEQLNRQLKQEQKEAREKNHNKLDKLASRLFALPLERLGNITQKKANKICKNAFSIYRQIRGIFDIKAAYHLQKKWMYHLQSPMVVNISTDVTYSQSQLYQDVQDFLISLKRCRNFKEVKKIVDQIGIEIDTPEQFSDWMCLLKTQKFQRYLIQSYYYAVGKNLFTNSSGIKSLLVRKKLEKTRKIEGSLSLIRQHITHCQSLSLDETKKYFANLHIYIDQVQSSNFNALTTKQDWNQCILDDDFCKALANQWINYQDTVAQLSMQAMRQTLLSKNIIERKFLIFRGAEYVASIISSIFQLFLCIPQAKLLLATSMLELFVMDIAKLGIPGAGLIYVLHPLYPDMSFKIDSLIMALAEHFFAIKYKPNEYSLEGYKLMIQARWLGFVSLIHYFISLMEQSLLWVNMRLIENCIMRVAKTNLEEDERYIYINEKYETYRLKCKKQIKELENALNQLKQEDIKLMINPQNSSSSLAQYDPIQALLSELENANFEFFSIEIQAFFEENLGLNLTESNKPRLKESVKHLFTSSESEFIKTYQINHQEYLRLLSLQKPD